MIEASSQSFEIGLELITILLFGLVFGSFATALIYRIPRGHSWITASNNSETHGVRSACTDCGATLTARDLIPLFSWLLSKGKCRHCKKPVSKLYPFTEGLAVLGCLGVYAAFGFTPTAAIVMAMIPFLVALFVIDLQHKILPNQLVLITSLFGVAYWGYLLFLGEAELMSVLILNGGGAVFFALFSWGLGALMTKILKKDALGFGDVKFFACAGLWLGLHAFGLFCFLSGICGVWIAIAWQKFKNEKAFPFGPALILSFYILLLLQGSHFI